MLFSLLRILHSWWWLWASEEGKIWNSSPFFQWWICCWNMWFLHLHQKGFNSHDVSNFHVHSHGNISNSHADHSSHGSLFFGLWRFNFCGALSKKFNVKVIIILFHCSLWRWPQKITWQLCKCITCLHFLIYPISWCLSSLQFVGSCLIILEHMIHTILIQYLDWWYAFFYCPLTTLSIHFCHSPQGRLIIFIYRQ